MRAVVFANGVLNQPETVKAMILPDDLLIAADGGTRNCWRLGLNPAVVIGDFDSLTEQDLATLEAAGTQILRYPTRKDYTDLELAIMYAQEQGAQEVLVLAALGARWDQTLANLLLPAAGFLGSLRVSLVDGSQEILLSRGGQRLEVRGQPGDTVSLIPLGGDAQGVTTFELEYPLRNETLLFGGTRGISNVMISQSAAVDFRHGLLLCVIIHQNNHHEQEL